MRVMLLLAGFLAVAMPSTLNAGQFLGSYQARLGPQDHFNSRGKRLTVAAHILRQDRANYHKFGKRDPDDQGDPVFSNIEMRKRMQRELQNNHFLPAPASVLNLIVNGQPLIQVDVYTDHLGITLVAN